jgi:hypothetical protein
MRRLILLVCALMVFAGCESQSGQKPVAADANGGGKFPAYLVGTWKTPSYDWEFTFEPNGTISSIVHNLGGVRITAGQTTTAETLGGRKAVFQPGPWDVQYSGETRELTVWIVMDHIHFEMGPGLLEGTRADTFSGKVSDDGSVWQADWFSLPDLVAHTSFGEVPMKAPDEQSFVETLEFRKVEKGVGATPSQGDANQ